MAATVDTNNKIVNAPRAAWGVSCARDTAMMPIAAAPAGAVVSNALATEFCVEALQEALARDGAPEIFNTDQCSPCGESPPPMTRHGSQAVEIAFIRLTPARARWKLQPRHHINPVERS